VPLPDLAPLLFPATGPEQESQLRCGWHDFRHPQGAEVHLAHPLGVKAFTSRSLTLDIQSDCT